MIDVKLDATRAIRKLTRDLGKIPPDLRKELRPALKRGAEPVLSQARANASWSSRIPRATRITTKFAKRRGGVVIVTSAKRAPHARPFEGISGDPFRHPVFGNRDVWVAQKARPFLFDAVEEKGEAVTKELADTIVQIGRRHGWK
ncbi:HK97 gp10 family phage protein [Herbidospora daliensis]|uniref:HK97 gp10 family phage protein n=1 Tax=Herbidospora daliensis TaxID=295585 RepID=UPI0007832D69|nr:HK97 gp10 family phage protein [Herbidospora daliensis]